MPLINAPLRTLFFMLSTSPIELDATKTGAENGEPAPHRAAAIAQKKTVT